MRLPPRFPKTKTTTKSSLFAHDDRFHLGDDGQRRLVPVRSSDTAQVKYVQCTKGGGGIQNEVKCKGTRVTPLSLVPLTRIGFVVLAC